MTRNSDAPHTPINLVVSPGTPLHSALLELGRRARLVFFAGLPGTGKSLLIHQLAHLAHSQGRKIYLLQWDVVRPMFKASRMRSFGWPLAVGP